VNAPAQECPACVASRRSPVDAFLIGYRIGMQEQALSIIEADSETADAVRPPLCLAHDEMVTRAVLAVCDELGRRLRK